MDFHYSELTDREGGGTILTMRNIFLMVLWLSTAAVTGGTQVNWWHSLNKLTPAQRNSTSYKFLVSKFGATNLLTECDTEEAALLGREYLFQVMGSGKDTVVGETIGHGSDLQEALDNAASSYISSATVRAFRKEEAQEEAEREKREREFRKLCCVAK